MSSSPRVLIPSGTVFTAEEITHFAGMGERSLDEAIAEADVLVSCPHAGAAIPEELDRYLAPEFTERLQYDFTDVATAAIVRRWAEIDSRIVAVINPHPRMVRDPNRERPVDLGARLREAIARVREAGPYQRVDLTGVDAIRPVTFSFYPLLRIPDSAGELDALVATFERVAGQGLGVYEATRDALRSRFVDVKLAQARANGGASVTTLSFHDTMNHTTTVDGAVNVERDPADRLPNVVALSNRGDHLGDPRDPAAEHPVTMAPELLRALAEAHRSGFEAGGDDVQLNQPYLGSQEIIDANNAFRAAPLAERAAEAGLTLSAVQAEFLREYLLGEANARELQQPGTRWIVEDVEHVDRIAHRCAAAWDTFRTLTAT